MPFQLTCDLSQHNIVLCICLGHFYPTIKYVQKKHTLGNAKVSPTDKKTTHNLLWLISKSWILNSHLQKRGNLGGTYYYITYMYICVDWLNICKKNEAGRNSISEQQWSDKIAVNWARRDRFRCSASGISSFVKFVTFCQNLTYSALEHKFLRKCELANYQTKSDQIIRKVMGTQKKLVRWWNLLFWRLQCDIFFAQEIRGSVGASLPETTFFSFLFENNSVKSKSPKVIQNAGWEYSLYMFRNSNLHK